MALNPIDTHQFSQATTLVAQGHKSASAVRPSHDGREKTQEQQRPHAFTPAQDHVTLSKEAQVLSTSPSQPSNNNTFQHTPSPLDR